jgi:hypothetical protein
MSLDLKKRASRTVLGVVTADLVLFFSNSQVSSHYALAKVRPVALAFGSLLIVIGVLAQIWAGRDARRRVLRQVAYEITLVSSIPYGLMLLVAAERLMFFQKLP